MGVQQKVFTPQSDPPTLKCKPARKGPYQPTDKWKPTYEIAVIFHIRERLSTPLPPVDKVLSPLVEYHQTVADITTAPVHNLGPDTISNSRLCVGLFLLAPHKLIEPIANIPSVRLSDAITLALLGNSLAHKSTMGPIGGLPFYVSIKSETTQKARPKTR